ncbi:MAG: nitroreductase family protein [Bryobacteraceae bacterium]
MSTTRRKLLRSAALTGGGLAVGGGALAAHAPKAAPGGDPAGLLALFAKRQTVRRYKMDPVPDEHLRLILDAARRPPTCMNQQPWKFLVVRDKAKIERMRARTMELALKYAETAATPAEREARKAYMVGLTEGYFTAPLYVVVLTDSECPCAGYNMHDGPMAAAYLMLAARALGYGTAYLTDGIPDLVTREVLAIPSRYKRVCITPIGVPDGWPEPKPKKKLEELVAYETL